MIPKTGSLGRKMLENVLVCSFINILILFTLLGFKYGMGGAEEISDSAYFIITEKMKKQAVYD
jgi:hypothetical protein